jgi:hypothetical protein
MSGAQDLIDGRSFVGTYDRREQRIGPAVEGNSFWKSSLPASDIGVVCGFAANPTAAGPVRERAVGDADRG